MNKITYPLKPERQGTAVADLQNALQECHNRRALLANDSGAWSELQELFKRECIATQYGDATQRLVSFFQEERGLKVSGEVDERTAIALNNLLVEWGIVSATSGSSSTLTVDTRYLVQCRVVDSGNKPIAGLRVEAYDQDPKTPDDPLGEPATTQADGSVIFRFRQSDFTEHPGERGPDLYFKVYLGETSLDYELLNIRNDHGVLRNFKQQRETIDIRVDKPETIQGAIISELRQPAANLKLRLYRRDFGGTFTLLNESVTGDDGRYTFIYNSDRQTANLEVRALKPDGTEVLLTKPINNLSAESRANMNLLVPGSLQPLAAEYQRLTKDLQPHVGNMRKLKDAKEDEQQQDLTVLSSATGWDARLIALTSVTERLASETGGAFSSEMLYGLLRAGLPSDKQLLAQVDSGVIEQVIRKVRDAGIIQINEAGIKEFMAKYTSFAHETRLAMAIPGSRSTYKEMLNSSGLNTIQQDVFASVFFKHSGDSAQLWKAARDEAGLNGGHIRRLQLQGKLAFLAGNSEPMTARLMNKNIKEPVELVTQGFHSPEKWKLEVLSVAFQKAGISQEPLDKITADKRSKIEAQLDDMIPVTYAVGTVFERLDAYAEDVARKVRLSFPTQVLGHLIEKDDKYRFTSDHEETVSLLKNITEQGFRFGETPISMFLQSGAGTGNQLSEVARQTATEQLKTLQRVYQITPANEAMPVLTALGIQSAFDVTGYSEKQFTSLFNAKYQEIWNKPAPSGMSENISSKSTQVCSVTYNLFAIARKLDSDLPIMAISGTEVQHAEAKNDLKSVLKSYPTMESLFGSMDYCECEHCRSVLSPAAYLVDLLQFVDAEPQVWSNFLTEWNTTHGEVYKGDWDKKPDGSDRKSEERTPYDALIERRPDLPHIALTCENTNTALPYIDLVNEILEYYVANNGKLSKETARDTGEATTAELLAEPQYVISEAYKKLRKAKYPLNLPFDLWLETIRKFCDYFETPLYRVLDVMRPDEDIVAEIKNPTNIGNATVTIANSVASSLSTGTLCSYLSAGINALCDEWMRISGIGAPDSGDQGQTIVTFAGTWATAPADGDVLISRPLDHRAAIFMESLALSPAEADMYADPNPLSTWYELYGYNSDTEATTEKIDPQTGQRVDLNSAKTLSRKLGVTYKEITEIVQTEFVNPGISDLTLLYKLGISVRDVMLYRDGNSFYEANKYLLGKDRATLSPADQTRFDNLEKKYSNWNITGWDVLHGVEAIELKLQVFAKASYPSADDTVLHDKIEEFISSIEQSFDKVLVLADLDTGCNFDQTTLRYANGSDADAIVFLRINLFVRLWRKLGWSIEETDRALTAFIPQSTPFDGLDVHLAKQPLKTALIYIAHLKELDKKLKVGKQSRLKLLTLWSDIATTGKKPLYEQLFLTRTVLRNAPVFDNPFGQYLADHTIQMKDHLLSLQGALGLTADEIDSILSEKELSIDGLVHPSAPLSLSNVSLLYRYALLAKALKISVLELIALRQLSGFDPFKALDTAPLETLGKDYPLVQTLEFIKIADEVRESGLKIEDLEYLLRHRFDETGKYRVDRDGALAFLKSLSEGVRSIRAEHAVLGDPAALREEVLRQKLGLALTPDVVERFLGMVNGTAEFTASTTNVVSADKFDSSTFSSEERIRDVSYKEVPDKVQKLTIRGVLLEAEKFDLKNKFISKLNSQQQTIFDDLLDSVQASARAFFDNYLKKQTLPLDGESGFLDEHDYEDLFAPLEPLIVIFSTDTDQVVQDKQTENKKIETRNQETLLKRRDRIGQAFLPFLQKRLIRQFIVQTMTVHTGADPALVESLVSDNRYLAAPVPLLDVFARTADKGVDATFWHSADGSGTPDPVVLLAEADTGLKGSVGKAIKPNDSNSVCLVAYLEVPVSGAYRFYVEVDKKDAKVKLSFPHLSEPLLVQGQAGSDGATFGDETGEYLELKAGFLYRLFLELKNLGGGNARLLIQGETLPKGPLSQLTLYSADKIDAADRALTLLTKALLLVQSLGLSQREIQYLCTHFSDFDGLRLSELPTERCDNSPSQNAATAKRFAWCRRLAAYARIKRELAAGTDDLIAIFEANGTKATDRLEKQVYPLLAKLARRKESTIGATAKSLVKAPAMPSFESEKALLRLWDALQVVECFGVPPSSLTDWAEIVQNTTDDEQRYKLAHDVKETIKARFEPEAWQRVAQPIFDKLRARQRDALVSYILQQMSANPETANINTQEKLYEYFLVDPGMEPVVQTSRIRLAIGSLQLFIQRGLLNLEPRVHPSTINSKQWEWMKRYRVWEANRKIFLFPENWLEPEFRDDKTHLFTELEGTMLQGDVSSDLVEDAFLNYLKKLDELARLDICAMHIEDIAEDNANPAFRVLHVFGRTYSQPRKYFYRRYAHQMWTPWEPVSAEIEGDHLAPVVWRDRLYLFWVTFMVKAQQKDGDTIIDTKKKIRISAVRKDVEAQLHWSEYMGGEWSTRESGDFVTPSPVVAQGLKDFDPKSVFVHVTKEYKEGEEREERGVYIHLHQPNGDASSLESTPFNAAFYLAGRNSTPECCRPYVNKPSNPFTSATEPSVNRYRGGNTLTVDYKEMITTEAGKSSPSTNHFVLNNGEKNYTILPCNNSLKPLGISPEIIAAITNNDALNAAIQNGLDEIATLIKPVFYQDSRHTLFIEPEMNEVTLKKWEAWVTQTPVKEPAWKDFDWWKYVVLISQMPRNWPRPVPDDSFDFVIDPGSLIASISERDWLINSGSAIRFNDVLIGPKGQSGVGIMTKTDTAASQGHISIALGSDLPGGSTAVLKDASSFAVSGLQEFAGGLNVLGSAGFNAAMHLNMSR